jgi:hypothetical protein
MPKADAPSRNGPKTKKDTRFKPRNPGGPGRPKGSKDRLSNEFLSALAADFTKHGDAVIAAVRRKAPAVYLRIVADLVPKDLNLMVMSHEEALRALA